MKRYDPIEFYDQGGSGYGQMRECDDGDFVKAEDVRELEIKLEYVKARIAQMESWQEMHDYETNA